MNAPSRVGRYLGVAWKLALLAAVILAASQASTWVMAQLNPHLTPSTEPALHRLIMTATTVYIVLMTLPFVPGAEIGLGMMMTFGPKIAPLVYGSTVVALTLSFLVGRLVPQPSIIRLFETLRLGRAAHLLRELETLGPEERLQFLLRNASSKTFPFLLRHRFLALIVALNLPGNAIIGGGGGICLVAGFSRLFAFPQYVLAVAVAVAPVPLTVLLTGT